MSLPPALLPPLATVGESSPTFAVLSSDLWQQISGDSHALLWLALLQVAFVVAVWIAARALVPKRELNSFGQYDRREGAGLAKALALYLAYAALLALGLFLLRFAGSGFQVALLSALTKPTTLVSPWRLIMEALGLITLILALVLPMAIFGIRLVRAVTLLALVLVLAGGAGWLLDRALGRPVETRLAALRDGSPAKQGSVLQAAAGAAQEDVKFNAAERVGQDPANPIPERKAAVRSLYVQLEELRGQLVEGDDRALAEYNRKNARYEALLQSLRAELAAHPESAGP